MMAPQEIIIKVLQNLASPEELKQFENWLRQSDSNRQYFAEIRYTWHASSLLHETKGFDRDLAWEKTKMKIRKPFGTKKIGILLNQYFIRYAAVFILAFILGSIFTIALYRNKTGNLVTGDESMQEVSSPLGSKSRVVLSDGTEVWLNAGSRLRYANSYNSNHRDVYLEGEGFFNVKKNPKKPFIVKASDIYIKAYGTSFNVKAYTDEGTITTTLVEGIVKVQGYKKTKGKFEISLKPKEKLIYFKNDSARITVTEILQSETRNNNSECIQGRNAPVTLDNVQNTGLYTSWKDDRWILEREKFENLVVMLGRRYNVQFICESNELKDLRFSGSIRKETLEQVLDILKLTAPLNYEIKDGIVKITPDPLRSENYIETTN
jgi:ferric-dicitrate binding protein FerR (iron transport regulator)